MSDVIPTMAVMPMTTPRIVNAERSLLLRKVSSAMRTTSPASPLFTAECLNRIQRRGARRGVHPEEQSDRGRDADAEHHRPRLELGRKRRDGGNGHGGEEPERDADQPTENRQHHR